MSHLILVTGGARSGKSDYALKRAESIKGAHCFLATCPIVDSEMDDRISRHKTERNAELWHTIEEETEIATTLQSLESNSICLIDCLTLWVNNLMFRAEKSGEIFGDNEMQRLVKSFVEAAVTFQGTLICVTNEVGMGIVPDNSSARLYRDLVGRSNRMIAEVANEVILVSCGIPLFLKH